MLSVQIHKLNAIGIFENDFSPGIQLMLEVHSLTMSPIRRSVEGTARELDVLRYPDEVRVNKRRLKFPAS